ncbi:MAG TPA: FkbM family methyltransferase [Thermoanaerobaculia bacterium]|nr:FkbM family methyltransferase [Thermoanaerobaculia bacterium]
MRSWVELALTRAPWIYSQLLRRRRQVDHDRLAFVAVIRRGDVVFDIGANQGSYTLLFSHLVGRHGRVHAFEPMPPTFAALAAHLDRVAHFDNVVANDCALAAREGELRLFMPGSDHAQAAIVPHAAGSWTRVAEVRSYPCRAATVDGYLRARGEAPPDFVKCDVEGAELRVLEGACETLRSRPPLLYLEINPDWTRSLGYAPPDLARFLQGFGYTRLALIEHVVDCSLAAEVRPLDDPLRELAAFRGSANLLCAVPELHAARLRRLLAAAGLRGAAPRRGGGGGGTSAPAGRGDGEAP